MARIFEFLNFSGVFILQLFSESVGLRDIQRDDATFDTSVRSNERAQSEGQMRVVKASWELAAELTRSHSR